MLRTFKALLMAVTRWTLMGMVLAMTLVLFAQIIFRYFLKQPLIWSEELALVLMIWITFLGSALLLATKEHISIDFMVELMPPFWQRLTAVVAALLLLAFNVALMYGAWLVAQRTAGSTSPGLGVSMAWHYAGSVIGSLLLAAVSLEELVIRIRALVSSRTEVTS